MDKYSVKFSGNDISLINGVDLYNHNFNDLPNRDIKINKLARRDLSIITSSEYTSKNIPVFLEVCSGTRADTEDTLTFLKSLLQPQNALLVVSQGGEDTQYIATMNEFNIVWEGTTALVTIVFLGSDPIGKNTTSVTLASQNGITTANYSVSTTIEGSATAFPTTNITINSITGGTGKSITVANGKTGQGITITRDYIAGDIIIINSRDMNATANGTLVDFTGMFPVFPAGSGQITYLDNFTTRNIDINSVYNPRLV